MAHKVAKKTADGMWPINQVPPHPDEGKDPQYFNRPQTEKVSDWIKGIGNGLPGSVFPTGQAGVKGVN